MCHDAQLVQRGLPVEEHHVSIYQVSLHDIAILELLGHLLSIPVFQKPKHGAADMTSENKVSVAGSSPSGQEPNSKMAISYIQHHRYHLRLVYLKVIKREVSSVCSFTL